MLRRIVTGLLLVLLAALSPVVLGPSPAHAGPGTCTTDDGTEYVCEQPGGDGDTGDDGDSDGGSAPAQPTCTLFLDYTFCVGTQACRMIEWQIPYRLPEGPKPQPDSEPLIRQCATPGGANTITIYWSDSGEPQPPSLADQARTAVGQLDLVLPDVLTSPDGRTLVNVPTWYWLDGAPAVQVGTSAFGLRAVATVRDLSVDPGDGSGAFGCPWTTSSGAAEKACSHTYGDDSDGGGQTRDGKAAFLVTATATWDLSFTYNGVAVANIPGAPATLDSPPSTTVLRVDEMGAFVTRVD